MMDSDGDGELTASEIYNALVKLGMPQSSIMSGTLWRRRMKMGTALSVVGVPRCVAADLIPEGWNRKWETGQLRKYDVSSDQYLVFVLQDHLNI